MQRNKAFSKVKEGIENHVFTQYDRSLLRKGAWDGVEAETRLRATKIRDGLKKSRDNERWQRWWLASRALICHNGGDQSDVRSSKIDSRHLLGYPSGGPTFIMVVNGGKDKIKKLLFNQVKIDNEDVKSDELTDGVSWGRLQACRETLAKVVNGVREKILGRRKVIDKDFDSESITKSWKVWIW